MRTYRKKTAAALLAAVLLAGGATACEDGRKADKGDAKASEAAPPAKAPAMAPAAYLEKVERSSEEITSLRYTMSGGAGGQKVSGEVSMRLKPDVAMSMVMANPQKAGEKIDIRLVGGVMYMGAQDKWLKFDLKAAGPESAAQLDALGDAGQSGENPGDRAGALKASKDLKVVGEETVDGQKTTHLSGTVTLDQMKASLAGSSPEAKARKEKQIKRLEQQGVTSLLMDMWIDGSDHTKQMRIRGRATQGPMDMTIKFLDYNKPVQVNAPTGEVVDLGEAMKDKGAGSGTQG
ncbi:LppX_LprAFG lipoprotein [Streptomyces bambusae]|uniref:LppX_LprAFG lipoprotein n=1 Tax=Streptomyces bambusae TaxID=1550616 RepID=UPI001CFEC985|nr:LppX_LprAFG lipoprotein [Streptomyces bambusae]MCB5165972.1 LppX_LprAFG lipoprotein [Streptomyces bambusae]